MDLRGTGYHMTISRGETWHLAPADSAGAYVGA
jgi:hypothetical protein